MTLEALEPSPLRQRHTIPYTSDAQTRIIFKDPVEEAEYRRLRRRVGVLSSLTYFLMFGLLYAVLFGLVFLLALFIVPVVVIAIFVQRYQGRIRELENSDYARWEE